MKLRFFEKYEQNLKHCRTIEPPIEPISAVWNWHKILQANCLRIGGAVWPQHSGESALASAGALFTRVDDRFAVGPEHNDVDLNREYWDGITFEQVATSIQPEISMLNCHDFFFAI